MTVKNHEETFEDQLKEIILRQDLQIKALETEKNQAHARLNRVESQLGMCRVIIGELEGKLNDYRHYIFGE